MRSGGKQECGAFPVHARSGAPSFFLSWQGLSHLLYSLREQRGTIFRVNITWRTNQSISASASCRIPARHRRARHLPRRRLRLHRCPAQSAWRTRPHHHRGPLSSHSRGPDATPHRVLARAPQVRTAVPMHPRARNQTSNTHRSRKVPGQRAD